MNKRIIFKIDPLGNPIIEADGFIGTSCKDATKAFEDVFSGGEMNTVDKPEALMIEEDSEEETLHW